MKQNLILIGALVFSLGALSLSIFKSDNYNETAYIDYNKTYNECKLKKDLEGDLDKVVSSRKSELDSMQMELSFVSNSIQAGNGDNVLLEEFENMKHRYLTLQARYEDENMRLKEEYYVQIRTHINDKAKEFGESKGYDYVFAAVGDGSLMYANESKEVTKEFMEFLDK